MSNHPSRSRRLFYGVDRLHARPHRAHRGHGVDGPPDFHRTSAKANDRSYFESLRDALMARLAPFRRALQPAHDSSSTRSSPSTAPPRSPVTAPPRWAGTGRGGGRSSGRSR